jgi:crossover junction endodeoxyribonuclease RuvC
MPKYRTRSWRAFDPAAHAAKTVAPATIRLPVAATVRILGIDPGSQRTGYGVIQCDGASSKSLVHGCIAAGSGGSLNERLRRIFEGVQALIDRFRPDEIAIERVFVNRNVESALKLGHARGAALCAVPSATPVFEYTPRAVKLAVVGFGGAEKTQVAHMIRALLTLEEKLSADASDALAVAVCHANTRRVHALTAVAIGEATVSPGRLQGRAR